MRNWIAGMDISSLYEVETCGGRFYDNGKPGDAIDILKSYGMNMIRLRLWNHPFAEDGSSYGGGGNDIETVLKLAKRAKEKNIGWFLDFHYSDFWADPGKQIPPKKWQEMNVEELAGAVYDYTFQTLFRCREEGVLPEITAIGNELSNGLLWPYGKAPEYDNIVRFVNAGIRAVRKISPDIKVMLHLDNGGNNELYRSWFDSYFAGGGEDFEYIGLSYYPFWHGTLKELKANMEDIAVRYQKDLIVAEVSMGYTLEDYAGYEKLSDDMRKGMAADARLAEKIDYPMTPAGQAEFMKDVLEIIQNVPERRGKGFFYWEPAWIPVPGSGWASEKALEYIHENGPGGNEWANQALFDYKGNALPALNVIKDYSVLSEDVI